MVDEKENLTSNFSTEEKSVVFQKLKKTKLRKFLSKFKRRVLKHLWLVRTALVLGILGVLYLIFLLLGVVVRRTGVDYYLKLASSFFFTPSEKVKSINDRTSVLILGKGGEGHEAPDLTDTIILASFVHDNPSITLISLPRDIWIDDLRIKLNSAYYWGNKKKSLVETSSSTQKGGLILAKSEVEKITGQPVSYAIVIDFNGFREIIDVLGGVEVEVENSFTDKKYPIAGHENDDCGEDDPEYMCRYETVSFQKGTIHMEGETALKFVRSRNAEGDEGSDFARSSRQQKVITAIKDKVLTREILFSPEKLRQLRDVVAKYSETDIDAEAGVILARRLLQARDNVSSFVLPEDLLVNPPILPIYDNLYVFVPKGDSWEEVYSWVEEILAK